MTRLSAQAARAALDGDGEIALLDVREHGQYGEGHPLLAVNLPYSRLETAARALLPCRAARAVLLDDGDGVAERAARRLESLGYGRIDILDGGAGAWAAAGYVLYKGVNVPSKAFGELLEHARATPSLDPEALKARLDSGEALVLLDSRTPAEHRRMCIPGSVGCPTAELGYRLRSVAPDAATPIVVHCAGRTRSILGVETLRALNAPNPVQALRNGTQGWNLAGLDLEHGSELFYPPVGEAEREATRDAARDFRARHAVPAIDIGRLEAWRADAGRTLYLLDVRTAEEFDAGRLAGARHAPGGQLVQATDQWIAVRGARIVLSDDTGLRASVTAHWLRRMGHDAVVLDADVTAIGGLDIGTPSPPSLPELPSPPERLPVVAPAALPAMLAGGGALLDLRPSMAYRAGHIDGARWAIRPRLDRLGLAAGVPVVLAAGDAATAALAAADLRELGHGDVRHLPGDSDAWRAAGLDVVATPGDPPDADCIDYLFFVHDRHDGNLEAARAYLDWETGLIDQMDDGDRATFRLAP